MERGEAVEGWRRVECIAFWIWVGAGVELRRGMDGDGDGDAVGDV